MQRQQVTVGGSHGGEASHATYGHGFVLLQVWKAAYRLAGIVLVTAETPSTNLVL